MIDKEIVSLIPFFFPDPREVEYVTQELNRLGQILLKRDESFSVRLQAYILKCADGNIQKFDWAINMTDMDWRDTLMNAGFGMDINKHEKWLDKLL